MQPTVTTFLMLEGKAEPAMTYDQGDGTVLDASNGLLG